MMIFYAFIMAMVCGVTEFLPVSSNGHVIVMNELLGFEGPPGKLFEISLQLGAILAVCWLYRTRLLRAVANITRDTKDRIFLLNLLLAFAPAAAIGFLFHHFITDHLFNVWTVASMLVVGGIAILCVEKYKPVPTVQSVDSITPKTALFIGLYQSIAMIPGVSRSGATIMGSLLLGVERKAATEFSFFLAIPMIFAASFFDIFIHRHEINLHGLTLIAVGFVTSFFCAMIVVKWLLVFISRHSFVTFAWYRIVLGSVLLLVMILRHAL